MVKLEIIVKKYQKLELMLQKMEIKEKLIKLVKLVNMMLLKIKKGEYNEGDKMFLSKKKKKKKMMKKKKKKIFKMRKMKN